MKIGNGIVEEIFQKDRQREPNNVAPLTDIREVTEILNKLLAMNTVEVKHPFLWKLGAAMLPDIYNKLGNPRNERPYIAKHGALGYMPRTAKHLKELSQYETEVVIVSILAPKNYAVRVDCKCPYNLQCHPDEENINCQVPLH